MKRTINTFAGLVLSFGMATGAMADQAASQDKKVDVKVCAISLDDLEARESVPEPTNKSAFDTNCTLAQHGGGLTAKNAKTFNPSAPKSALR